MHRGRALPAFVRCRPLTAVSIGMALLHAGALAAAPVAVRHAEGLVHGFLALRTLEGDILADGDLIQVSSGDRVTSRLVFHFKDGSIHDETTVFSQRKTFRLLSDHLVQKGPAFPRAMDVLVDAVKGRVKVRYTDEDDKEGEKVAEEQFDVPQDLANGLVPVLLKNIRDAAPLELSMMAATPKPRLVKLKISSLAQEESFAIAGDTRKARHYVVKIEIGGVTGVLAELLGKEPPDIHVWILHGDAPAFLKSEGPLYVGGPSWRIELTSPVWAKKEVAASPTP